MVIKQSTYHCHRSILKHRAKYLYCLISHETSNHLITLNSLDRETVMALLRYIYAAELDL